jgi:soluble lytic murein transglycosylase-like protein
MPNNDFDDLFDAWGQALNVNPQLAKTIFHIESNGNPNSPDGPLSLNAPIGPDGKPERAQGGMQIMPSTAQGLATKLGFDPKAVDLHDMRWSVPLATAYLAEGLTATQGSPEGAFAYYFAGPNQAAWGPKTADYVNKAVRLYPKMALTPATRTTPTPPIQPDAQQATR